MQAWILAADVAAVESNALGSFLLCMSLQDSSLQPLWEMQSENKSEEEREKGREGKEKGGRGEKGRNGEGRGGERM